MIFNPWRPWPLWRPKKDGWYRCTVQYFDSNEKHSIDLYYHSEIDVWEDKRRQQVFSAYKVYKSGREPLEYNRIYHDNLCIRLDVIAWRNIERPCLWKRKENIV